MKPFMHETRASRVHFGRGALGELAGERERLASARPLLITADRLRDQVTTAWGGEAAATISGVRQHVPVADAEAARDLVRRQDCDVVIAVGGGSAIGLAKAVALTEGTPIIAVPTTFSGSEMTPVWGLTDEAGKVTGTDPTVAPQVVVYDPDLYGSLPPGIAGPSAINAMAHAVESLWAPDATPLASLMAEEAIRAIGTALPDLDNPERLEELVYGAWLCGVCLGSTTMSLHHKLCHVLGGTFGLPHAETHTILLPRVVAFNAAAAPAAAATVARALGASSSAEGLLALTQRLDAPRSLRELGWSLEQLETAVDVALARPYANPRPVTGEAVRLILTAAHDGGLPEE
jgi:maleylacetate reductase